MKATRRNSELLIGALSWLGLFGFISAVIAGAIG